MSAHHPRKEAECLILTCNVATVLRNIRKVKWHLKVHKLLRRKTQPVKVAVRDLVIGIKIKDEGVQVGNLQGDEVGSRIDQQVRISGEREVCGGCYEFYRDGTIEVACRRREWCILVDRERGHTRDEENEKDSNAKQLIMVSQKRGGVEISCSRYTQAEDKKNGEPPGKPAAA